MSAQAAQGLNMTLNYHLLYMQIYCFKSYAKVRQLMNNMAIDVQVSNF